MMEGIKQKATEGILRSLNAETRNGLLINKPANDWIEEARNRPIPSMLFGELWFEGELCIMYASSNVGKSILAVQIADSISKGTGIIPLQFQADPQPVLYFDFELSSKQFENRYSHQYEDHYVFSETFFRVEINHESEIPDKGDFNDAINSAIEREIRRTGAKVIIVDNITYLKNETEKSKDAIPLMKHLKKLKSKHGLSILALAHSPKRDQSRPINRNDLGGSAMLMNFCDSSFALGESNRDKSYRYIKQIKSRNCGHVYDTENVLVYEITKPDNWVHFNFMDYALEDHHLITPSAQEREDKKALVLELSKQGLSQRKIASEVGKSVGTINGWLKDQKSTVDEVPF